MKGAARLGGSAVRRRDGRVETLGSAERRLRAFTAQTGYGKCSRRSPANGVKAQALIVEVVACERNGT